MTRKLRVVCIQKDGKGHHLPVEFCVGGGDEEMSKLEKICVLDDEVQAQLLDAALTERKIPHLMRTYHDAAYDGLFQFSKGWGHVEAHPRHKEEILAILADLPQDDSAE